MSRSAVDSILWGHVGKIAAVSSQVLNKKYCHNHSDANKMCLLYLFFCTHTHTSARLHILHPCSWHAATHPRGSLCPDTWWYHLRRWKSVRGYPVVYRGACRWGGRVRKPIPHHLDFASFLFLCAFWCCTLKMKYILFFENLETSTAYILFYLDSLRRPVVLFSTKIQTVWNTCLCPELVSDN